LIDATVIPALAHVSSRLGDGVSVADDKRAGEEYITSGVGLSDSPNKIESFIG